MLRLRAKSIKAYPCHVVEWKINKSHVSALRKSIWFIWQRSGVGKFSVFVSVTILYFRITHKTLCLPASFRPPPPPPVPTTLFLHKLPSYIFLGWSHILKSISAKFCGQRECLIEDSEIVHSLLTRKYGKPQGCNWKTCKKKEKKLEISHNRKEEKFTNIMFQ